MSVMITRDASSTDDDVVLHVSNGDLKALQEVIQEWGFKDHESVFKFALAVLTQAKGNTVFIEDGSGVKVGLQPTTALKNEHTDDNPKKQQ